MILIVTNSDDPHADEVIGHLRESHADYCRLHTDDFPSNVRLTFEATGTNAAWHLVVADREIQSNSIHAVWYRRPSLPSIEPAVRGQRARQFATDESTSVLGGLWRVLEAFWISRPDNIRRAESKVLQLRVAPQLGFRIPRTLVTNDPLVARAFVQEVARAIVKPISTSFVEQGRWTYSLFSHLITDEDMTFLDALRLAPCLIQEYVEKDVEIRVTVVGNECFSAEIHSQRSELTKHDWRRYDLKNTPHLRHELPRQVAEQCVDLVRHFGLAFGAIDLIRTPEGRYVFLEINPNGQWLWIEQLTGLPIAAAMANALVNGRRRLA